MYIHSTIYNLLFGCGSLACLHVRVLIVSVSASFSSNTTDSAAAAAAASDYIYISLPLCSHTLVAFQLRVEC